MARKEKRKIVDELLSNKLLEMGCFMQRLFVEKFDNIEYRWDFIKLVVDEGWGYMRMEVDTYAGKVPIVDSVGLRGEYSFETEEDFKNCIQHIYEYFVNVALPEAEKKVEEEKKIRILGNPEMILWLEEQENIFEESCREKKDEEIYQEIVKLLKEGYEKQKECQSDWEHWEERKPEFRKACRMEWLADREFGKWVIRTQGGHWKSQYQTGYNQFVIVHPQNEKKMVDLEQLLHSRCYRMDRNLPAFLYEKDREFWKHVR